jgi:hypothetical protein
MQILDQAGRRDYTVKAYPNGSHNLMEVPPDNPNEYVRLKRFPRVSSKRWSTGQQHSFVGVRQQGVRPLTLWLQVMYEVDEVSLAILRLLVPGRDVY